MLYHFAAICSRESGATIIQKVTKAKKKRKGGYIHPFAIFCSLKTSEKGLCRGIAYHFAVIGNK